MGCPHLLQLVVSKAVRSAGMKHFASHFPHETIFKGEALSFTAFAWTIYTHVQWALPSPIRRVGFTISS